MADLVFVAVVLAFFGLAALLVQACDKIIGPDPAPAETADDGESSAIDLDLEEAGAW